MNKANLRRFYFFLLAAVIIATGFMTIRRAVKGSNDFDTFYQSGKAVLLGQGIYYSGEYYKKVPKLR